MPGSILVVEDTELLRKIYTDKLTQDGYVVHTATDGEEALALLRSVGVDLILLDLIMPNMSGLEALTVLKSEDRLRDIPVIILSNLGQESDIERGLALGAADYVIKNEAKPADVAERIRRTLDAATKDSRESRRYRVHLRDREGDADRLVDDAALPRRFWCPTCEVELCLELAPEPNGTGMYSAHFTCPSCEKEY